MIPFDLERLEVTGAPRPVIENVSTPVTNEAWFAVSDSGICALASVARERNRLLGSTVTANRGPQRRTGATCGILDFRPMAEESQQRFRDGARQSIWIWRGTISFKRDMKRRAGLLPAATAPRNEPCENAASARVGRFQIGGH